MSTSLKVHVASTHNLYFVMQILVSFCPDNQNSHFLCLFKHSFSTLNEQMPICLSYIYLAAVYTHQNL